MRRPLLVLAFLLTGAQSAPPPDRAVESEIADRINAYRVTLGLPPVPVSPLLTRVAEAHAIDLTTSADGGSQPDRGRDARGVGCNLHSWSDRGRWTPVCYTPDHRYAQAMWDKPREITGGAYPADGFEIAHWTSGTVDAGDAVAGWKSSAPHNAVMAEQDIWRGAHWQAMGVGVSGHVAFVWFGKLPDPTR